MTPLDFLPTLYKADAWLLDLLLMFLGGMTRRFALFDKRWGDMRAWRITTGIGLGLTAAGTVTFVLVIVNGADGGPGFWSIVAGIALAVSLANLWYAWKHNSLEKRLF
ncbi:MAG: hypothetical protein FD119_136 [Stygiobacter sp.]|nr:MAG: hypothetical protein FD119_136 [Stygiobacter sp.]